MAYVLMHNILTNAATAPFSQHRTPRTRSLRPGASKGPLWQQVGLSVKKQTEEDSDFLPLQPRERPDPVLPSYPAQVHPQQ